MQIESINSYSIILIWSVASFLIGLLIYIGANKFIKNNEDDVNNIEDHLVG